MQRTNTTLQERLAWVLYKNSEETCSDLAAMVMREIERTHHIVDPEVITENMLEACFNALPEHYDPPDMRKRAWHALKAKRRYTAMVKAAGKVE